MEEGPIGRGPWLLRSLAWGSRTRAQRPARRGLQQLSLRGPGPGVLGLWPPRCSLYHFSPGGRPGGGQEASGKESVPSPVGREATRSPAVWLRANHTDAADNETTVKTVAVLWQV